MKQERIKKLCVLAMICAIAFVIVALVRIPVVAFLKYEPKDVIITVGGFLYGPLATVIVSAIVSFIEFITISDTGWIGLIMNILSTVAFAGTAALVYKKKHTMSGAVLGLVLGSLLTTVVMVLWNYILTPIYMNQPRADIAAMLLPVFLPFNLIKSGLNSALTLMLYRPLVQALRGAHLFPRSTAVSLPGKSSKVGLYVAAGLVLLLCAGLIILFNTGIL